MLIIFYKVTSIYWRGILRKYSSWVLGSSHQYTIIRCLATVCSVLREELRIAASVFFRNARHQWILRRLVNLHLQVLKNLTICLDLPLAKCISKELSCLSLLLILLFQHIFEEVCISFHKSLCILKSMLQLFLSIPLNSLEQCGKCQLLSLSQGPFLLNQLSFNRVLVKLSLICLHLISLNSAHFCIFILTDWEKDFFLGSHIHELFRPVKLRLGLRIDLLW